MKRRRAAPAAPREERPRRRLLERGAWRRPDFWLLVALLALILLSAIDGTWDPGFRSTR